MKNLPKKQYANNKTQHIFKHKHSFWFFKSLYRVNSSKPFVKRATNNANNY